MRHQYATLWIWLFLLPLALDYKAPDANVGHFVQFIFVLPVIAAGLALALIAPRFHDSSRLRSVRHLQRAALRARQHRRPVCSG